MYSHTIDHTCRNILHAAFSFLLSVGSKQFEGRSGQSGLWGWFIISPYLDAMRCSVVCDMSGADPRFEKGGSYA